MLHARPCEVVDCSHRLDTRVAAAANYERQQFFTDAGILLTAGVLQSPQDAIANCGCVANALKSEGMLLNTRYSMEIGDRPESDDDVVRPQRAPARTVASHVQNDRFVPEVDVMDVALFKVDSWG